MIETMGELFAKAMIWLDDFGIFGLTCAVFIAPGLTLGVLLAILIYVDLQLHTIAVLFTIPFAALVVVIVIAIYSAMFIIPALSIAAFIKLIRDKK